MAEVDPFDIENAFPLASLSICVDIAIEAGEYN